MNDLKKVVLVTDFKVSVKHQSDAIEMMLNTLCFSEINNYYKVGCGLQPVKHYHTLEGLLERLNTIKHKLDKHNAIAILKGLYKDGTSGEYCYKGVPFLFFDVDVKETENKHLLDAYNNAEVFNELKRIAVMVWRSNSGKGMAGVLYVPQLAKILNIDKNKHLAIGNAITNYLTKTLNVDADFDNAQNKFRQVRYLAKQTEPRTINKTPYAFTYDLKEIIKVSETGAKQYRFIDNRAVNGSIADQFNNSTTIQTACLDNGLHHINSNRYRHQRTTSKTTGITKDNVFLNHSRSFSHYEVFTPYWLYLTENYAFDFKRFLEDLKVKGYKDIQPQQSTFQQSKKILEQQTTDRDKQIFTACYDLVNANYKDKVQFVNNNAQNESERILFYDYLKLKPLTITYNKTLSIKTYVSEQLKNVLDYADTNQKTILTAETGTGKTTAFLKDFTTHRPNKRLIILAPLTAIVEQIKAEFNNVVALTGNSTPAEQAKAKTAYIVIATYEQGYKHLNKPNTFDYVVIDEVHNLITANEYKPKTIKEITSLLHSYNVIGLTGTPNQLFKAIGYKLVNIIKAPQNKVDVNFIVDNRSPLKIALQHLKNVKGKCIIRINSRNVAKALKTELIKLNLYTDNDILLLNSDAHIKKGDDFKHLTARSKFNTNIKLVITTAIIDEGLSIRQNGFSDAVFIETDYKPMPEAVKQFFARFRNEDGNRKNYFYYRETKDQALKSWNPSYAFFKTKENLIQDAKTFAVNDTDKKGITNTRYLYYDNGFVNDYALAYDISNEFFGMMTKIEYIHFLELNYNLNIIESKGHTQTKIDTTDSKEQANKNKTLVAASWLNNKEEILNALYNLTDNLSLKKSIPYIGLNPPDEIYNLVSNNLKTFEDLHKNSVQLEALNIPDVDSVLIDKENIKPVDLRNVNRKIKLCQNIDIINNPKTKTDTINKKKIINFITDAKKLKTQTKSGIFNIWNKQRCNSKKPSYYNLIDLLDYYNNDEVLN
jgi:hypothetical protein